MLIIILALLFSFGSFLTHFFIGNYTLVLISSGVFILYIILWIINLFKKNITYTISIISFLLIFLISSLNIFLKKLIPPVYIENIEAYKAIITDEIKSNKYQKYSTAQIQKIKYNKQWIKYRINIKLYLNKKDNLKYGDIILVNNPPQKMNNNDFNKYLKKKNIYLKHNLIKQNKLKTYKIIENIPQNIIYSYSLKIKQKLKNILQKHIIDQDALGIILALLLGSKQLLNIEIKNLYRNLGIIHILALSGLHVGLIIWIISTIISLFIKRKKYKNIKKIIMIFSIWSFAFITGLSPSVTRAATMFSFLQIILIINKNTSLYSIIAISIIIMIYINPFIINDIGFILSFLSVFGIVYFEPRINKIFIFKNKFLNYFWRITTFTTSAQITTFPIVIFYFKQFPIYFLISNWIIIPFAFIVVSSGIIIIVSNIIPYFPTILGFILSKSIFIINYILYSIDKLPISSIKNIKFTIYDVSIIYILLILISSLEKFRRLTILFSIFILIIICSFKKIVNIEYKRNLFLIKTDQNDNKIFTLQKGFNKISLFKENYKITINDKYFEKNINKQRQIPIKIWKNIILISNNNKLIGIIDHEIKPLCKIPKKIIIDKLIVKNDSIKTLYSLTEFFEIKKLEISNYKNYKLKNRLIKESQILNINTANLIEY